MPFKSRSQLRTCYGKKITAEAKGEVPKWDCKTWLDETPNPTCLPNRLGEPPSKNCRELKKEELGEHEWHIGRRGGLYRFISGIKIYAPKDQQVQEYILKTFKPTEEESGSESGGTSEESSIEESMSPPTSPKRSPEKKGPRSPKKSPTSRKRSPIGKSSGSPIVATRQSPSKKSPSKVSLVSKSLSKRSPSKKTSAKRAPSKKGGKYTKLMLENMPLTLLKPLAKGMGISIGRLNKDPLIEAILSKQAGV